MPENGFIGPFHKGCLLNKYVIDVGQNYINKNIVYFIGQSDKRSKSIHIARQNKTGNEYILHKFKKSIINLNGLNLEVHNSNIKINSVQDIILTYGDSYKFY